MFVTKPSGALRLVPDFRQLNKFLERPHHPFLTTGMVTKMLKADSSFFAMVDLVSAYHQVPTVINYIFNSCWQNEWALRI